MQNLVNQPVLMQNASTQTEDEDIEREEIDQTIKLMDKPFDPTKINIDTKTPSLDTLIERIAHDEIQLNTESYFQRKDDLWDIEKQSRLIESILIRFPLPAFYFDGSDKDKWLVVDGLQRLSSIRNFVVKKDKPLKLTNLEFLTQLNGKTYQELDRDLKRIIKETQVVVYIINPGTPIDVKFNIFKRINTGGLVLEPQEIRHALFQGAPAEFVAELGQTSAFIEATTKSIRTHRMLDRDMATRFLCFYLFGYENYTPDLDTFMSKAMAAIYTLSDDEKRKIKEDFIASMKLNRVVFGDHAFRKIENMNAARKPINKALFDVFSVQFAKLSKLEKETIAINKEKVITGFINLLKQDEVFFWAVTSSTSDKNRVTYRHSKIHELLQAIINNPI